MKVCLGENRFENVMREAKAKRAAALERILKEIPAGAIAACFYRPKGFPSDREYWFLVTPGIRGYDESAWRVSLFDEKGPWTHWVYDDYHGKLLDTIEDGIRAVINYSPSVVLTEYITSDRRRITLDPVHACP